MKNIKPRLSVSHISDFGLNILAFGLYIAMQQLVIMPVLSSICDDSGFSKIILFISIFNILSIVVGDELGNARMIRVDVYERKNISGDFHVIIISAITTLVVLFVAANYFVGISWEELLIYLSVIVVGIVKYFSMSYYKLKQRFGTIVFINLFYVLGGAAGVYVAVTRQLYLAPFVIGEVFSFLFIMFIVFRDKERCLSLSVTPEFNRTLITFTHLSLVSVMVNTVSYLDRIIIYPLLGATAMAVYFSASSMSKMVSLVVNPISGVVLAKLSLVKDGRRSEIISTVFKALFPSIIIFFIVSMIVSFFGVKVFYPKYYEDAIDLFVPIGFATSFSLISFLLKPLIMTFCETRNLLLVHVLYAVVFCVSVFYFSSWWGVLGFAWASSLARFSQFLCYFAVLSRAGLVEELEPCS